MKKTLSLVLSVLFVIGVLVTVCLTASADNYNGLEYTVSGGEATITGCDSGITEADIPSAINGVPVTAIGDDAFSNKSIESVTIPGSVKSIGDCAFQYCSSLGTVTLGSGIESIGYRAFDSCSITAIEIPGSVKIIGYSAFLDCSSLGSVTLGSGIESIGNRAFYCCSITAIEIPDSVKSIGFEAFYNCPITAIFIPGSVKSIGEHAFYNCESLSNVTLGSGIESIGNGAFYNCPITAIEIPGSVKSIDDYAFYECVFLSSVTLGSGIERIGDYVFQECPITAIEIPDSVKSIGDAAFLSCSITAIEIPGSVKSIGKSAFNNCKSLSRVTLGSGIESIGKSAFRGCPITAIFIPGSVKSIGENAFSKCASLGSVTLGSGIESIGNNAFYGCSITSIIIPKSVKIIGNNVFLGCNFLKDVYYRGSRVGWDSIYIGDENDFLLDADIHFIGEPGITSHALVLSGEIGVVFNVKVPSDFEGTFEKLTFSVGKNDRLEMTLSNAVYNTGSNTYDFIYYAGAYNMADIITPTIVYTESNVEMSVTGEPYSAKDYIDYVRSHTGEYNDSVVALVNALADYGHYSQIYLGRIHGYTCGNRENDKYAEMTTYATDSFDVGEVMTAVEGKSPSVTEKSDKVTKVSFTLDLESKTNLYIDIEVKDGVVPDSATLADGTVLPVSKKAGNVYRVSINGINAVDLSTVYTVTVKAGEDTIATVTVSPMSYVYKVLIAQEGSLTESDIRDTVCALYAFSYAAANVTQSGVVNPPDPYGPVEPAGPSPYNPG